MNTDNGEILSDQSKEFLEMFKTDPNRFVPFARPLTEREHMTAQVDKYSPCACGSGRKFKFCCYARKHSVIG